MLIWLHNIKKSIKIVFVYEWWLQQALLFLLLQDMHSKVRKGVQPFYLLNSSLFFILTTHLLHVQCVWSIYSVSHYQYLRIMWILKKNILRYVKIHKPRIFLTIHIGCLNFCETRLGFSFWNCILYFSFLYGNLR